MRRALLFGVIAALIALNSNSIAQTSNLLVGAWERISLLDGEGKPLQPPGPAAFVIFSADGFFSQTAIHTGRAKIDKPFDQFTKEELVARFNRLEARRGTYTVAGNVLVRKNIAHGDPNQEGTEARQNFRIEKGILILSNVDPKLKNEARFRRAK
jgi:hypothetical protein